MRVNVTKRFVSSILIFAMLVTSVAPALTSAQTAEAIEPVTEEAVELPETDHSDKVTKSEVREALETMPELLGTSDDVEVTRDADSAIIVETEETVVDIPKDPEEGITLGLEDGTELTIELPNADEAKNAKRVAPGVVAYPATDGSANAVQADESGGVRMLTIIDNADAPTEYEYKVTVPDGGRIELTAEGGALIFSNTNESIAFVGLPWAQDSTGRTIETWFTTDGITLTQHISHNQPNIAYPVTADPTIRKWYGWDFELTRTQTNNLILGINVSSIVSGLVGLTGVGWPAGLLAAALRANSSYMNWVYNKGGCARVSLTYIGYVSLTYYKGGNCK